MTSALTSTMYEIRDTPNYGLGVYATKFIPAGTLIVSERPFFTTPSFTLNSSIISSELQKLSKEDQRLFLSFSNIHKDEPTLTGIAKTNCIPMPERFQVGLFKVICRMNHSCRPNAQYFWNDNTNIEVCHAINDIKQGEQITVCYSEFDGSEPLRSTILENHKFYCCCNHCSTKSPAELAQSDLNTAELSATIDVTPDLLQTNPTQAIRGVKRALEIINIENLPGLASAQYYDGFQVAAAWGDMASAKVWAERTAQAYTSTRGKDYIKVDEMMALARNPKSHRLWRVMGTRKIELP